MKTFQDLYPYTFDGLQTVEGQNYSFSAASKGYKRYQTMKKGHMVRPTCCNAIVFIIHYFNVLVTV